MNAQIRAKIARVQAEGRSMADAYQMYNLGNNSWPIHDHTPRQHHWVTTPVAYLSTSIIDIFGCSGAALQAKHYQYNHGLYHCEPSFYWYHSWPLAIASDPQYFAGLRNSSFFVTSFGPDQDFDQSEPSAALFNASNGLSSNGDLLFSVNGTFKPGYPYTEGLAIFNY